MDVKEIRNLRAKTGLNQREFGKRIGATYPMVNSWELGRSLPPAEMVLRLRRLQQELLEKRLAEGKPPSINAAVEAILFEQRVGMKVRVAVELAHWSKVALQLLVGEMKPKELREAGKLAAELVRQVDAALCGEVDAHFEALDQGARDLLLRKFGAFPKMLRAIEERVMAEVIVLATPQRPRRPWEPEPQEVTGAKDES